MKPASWSRNKPPHARITSVKSKHVNPSEQGTSVVDGVREKLAGLTMSAATTPKDVSDCISSWLAYLQMLNGLCNAGSRLTQCLCGLSQENHVVSAHCQSMWEELVRASTVASSSIKTNVLTGLQELSLVESDSENTKAADLNQAISNSLAALIQLQYQFCAACCEWLAPVLGCPCPPGEKHESDCSTEAVQQCFHRLFPPPAPNRPARSPLPVALAPFSGCQRRWSEAAAQEVTNTSDNDGVMRRWSMPWENSKLGEQQAAWPGARLVPKNKLAVPGASQDRSRSTTPESAWHSSMASQEELQEVIQLLSCPVPSGAVRSVPSSGKAHPPGVVLTSCNYELPQTDPWSEAATPGSRRGSNSPHRGPNWPNQEAPGRVWNESEAQTPSGGDGNYELSPATLDPAALASRKSSSSTDSSSSYSLHSRSTTGSISAGSASDGAQEARTQLYSMWSGADLPFIKLSESTETIEETPTDVQQTYFTHKSH